MFFLNAIAIIGEVSNIATTTSFKYYRRATSAMLPAIM